MKIKQLPLLLWLLLTIFPSAYSQNTKFDGNEEGIERIMVVAFFEQNALTP